MFNSNGTTEVPAQPENGKNGHMRINSFVTDDEDCTTLTKISMSSKNTLL